MSLSVLSEPPVPKTPRAPYGNDSRDPDVRLPLRTELFLAAHDDDTGRRHIDRQALCLGLAGAVLLELWRTGRVLIGKAHRVRDGFYTPDLGRITIIDPTRHGDPLTDAAMALLRRTGGPTYVTDFIRRFATPELYDRVRGDMLATGILRRVSHRRFRWFTWSYQDRYLPARPTYAVRVRVRLRNLPNRWQSVPSIPDADAVALAGLVTALGLTRHLHHADPAALHARLMDLLYRSYDSTIRDVTNAVTSANRRIR